MDGFVVPAYAALGVRTAALRVGVLGAGTLGARHARLLAGMDSARLMGVADGQLASAQALVAATGGRAFSDAERLIAVCDAVVIAADALRRAPLAEMALEAGRHVLVEKPLAVTPEDAERLVALAHRRGLVLQAGHHERVVFESLGLAVGGAAPEAVRCVRERPAGGERQGVSVTMELMIHDLDLVARLFGASPMRIEAQSAHASAGGFDHVQASLGFAAGDAMLVANRAGRSERRIVELVFASGAIEIDLIQRTVRNDTAFGVDEAALAAIDDPVRLSLAHFLRAADGRGACVASGESAAAAVRLAARIDAAAGASRRVWA